MSDTDGRPPVAPENVASPSRDPEHDQTVDHDANDANDGADTTNAPPADHGDDSDNDSVLSDLDDEAFTNYNEQDFDKDTIPIDTDTLAAGLGRHKRKGGATGDVPKRPQGRRRRDKRIRDEDEPEVPVEIELTEEESKCTTVHCRTWN